MSLPEYLGDFHFEEDKNSYTAVTDGRLAKALLGRNKAGNEKRRNEEYEEDYGRQMLEGLWLDNGEVIIISDTGELLDGQTRLGAVVYAASQRPDFSIELRYVVNVSSDTFQTIDIGRPRTPAHIIAISGLAGDYALHFLGAAIRIVWLFERNLLHHIDHLRLFPKALLPKMVEQYDGIVDSLNKQMRFNGGKWPGRDKFPARAAIACHFMFSRKDGQAADYFFDKLYDGTDLSKGNPIHALRSRLESGSSISGGVPQRIYECIYCWNAFREGRSLSSVRLPHGVPEII